MMNEVININPYHGYHFRVIVQISTNPKGQKLYAAKIVLVNPYGVMQATGAEKYVEYYSSQSTRPINSSITTKIKFIAHFLQWILIDSFPHYHFCTIADITYAAVVDYINQYSLTPDGATKSKQTIVKMQSYVCSFLSNVYKKSESKSSFKYTDDELYRTVVCYDRNGRPGQKIIPNFKTKVVTSVRPPRITDVSDDAVIRIIELALAHDPMIALGIAFQAFAGLRCGEVCNIRQETNPKHSGVQLQHQGTKLVQFSIDLSSEYKLRSDNIDVGSIKKERIQNVYPDFLPIIADLYAKHIELLKSAKKEEGYYPLFVGRNGKALTDRSYRRRVQHLIKHYLAPEFRASDDEYKRLLAERIEQNGIGTHFLRHWFSVYIITHTKNAVALKNWRGDSNIESSQVYLQNKKALDDMVKNSSNRLAEKLLMEEI